MRGPRLLARGLLIGTLVAASGSCLVVSDPDFQGQDECVPSFVYDEADPPLAKASRFPASPSDPKEFRGSIPMRSCALTKTYEARIFLDGVAKNPVAVPPTGTDVRNVPITVDVSRLADGCHQVEVYVSSRFSASDFRKPDRAGDLTYVVWWFESSAGAAFEGCGASE